MKTDENLPAPTSSSAIRPQDDHFRAGLALLWQAYSYSSDTSASPWDFALEINRLYEAGLSISDIRWLIAKGFAEHGLETSVYGDRHRSFRVSEGFNFESSTCLVLTSSGATLANRFAAEVSHGPVGVSNTPVAESVVRETMSPNLDCGLKPNWDRTKRELRLADAIVKRFRVPARNQETILCVFEEEGWPEHIDDPLPVTGDIDPQTRLHNAINRLNGRQTNHLIRFHGNGNGTGVSWKLSHQDLMDF